MEPGTIPAASYLVTRPHVPRILVVEDVDTTRRRMCSALRAYGYQAEEAFDGAQGLKLVTSPENHFDAILLDLMLPRLDGWRFREAQLRDARLSRIPTIIVTVRPLRAADKYVLRTETIIQKPFEDDVLVATVATACAAVEVDTPSLMTSTSAAAARSGRELFWSRRGEVACRDHAPAPGTDRWTLERWTSIPAGAGRDRVLYQCQHCSGDGPIRHRTFAHAGDGMSAPEN